MQGAASRYRGPDSGARAGGSGTGKRDWMRHRMDCHAVIADAHQAEVIPPPDPGIFNMPSGFPNPHALPQREHIPPDHPWRNME
jgi:hypothetical protein